jgi:hypothetical protein
MVQSQILCYAQVDDSLLKVPIIDGGHPEMGITVERLCKLMKSTGREIGKRGGHPSLP